MNEKSDAIFEPVKPLFASWARTHQVLIGQFEKWIALQMDSLNAYVDLGLSQAKVAMKITDPHSLHEFSDSQFAVLSFVGHRMMDDGRLITEWGGDCYKQANQLARENMLRLLFKY